MRWLAIALALLSSATALGKPYRLPLNDCDTPAGCPTPTNGLPLNKCYITAYRDWGEKDWNCGTAFYRGHLGTDIGTNGEIAVRPVVAGADGVVIERNDGCPDRNTTCENCGGGFGNYVKLRHLDGQETVYGHMAVGSVQVQLNDSVTCGQQLGLVGSSGCSTGAHLHFEVFEQGQSADPFDGPCSQPPTFWVDQGVYCRLPVATTCVPTGPDRATYLSETVPDGSHFSPGAAFTKSWTLQNTGTVTWTASGGYKLRYVTGERFNAQELVALNAGESIPVNGTRTFTLPMTAPATPGVYRGYWQMDHNGTLFGDRVWVQIIVDGPTSTDDAVYLSETVPDGTAVCPGSKFIKTWTLKNSGTTVWTRPDYALSWSSGETFGIREPLMVDARDAVAPNATKLFTLEMTAPVEPGTYTGYWQMTRNGTAFGDRVWVQIVAQAQVPSAIDNDGDCHVAKGSGGDDCDDRNASVFPTRIETCDGIDNDCDQQIDEQATCGNGRLCQQGNCVDPNADPGPDGDAVEGGCGCAAAGAGPAAALALLALAWLARKRASAGEERR